MAKVINPEGVEYISSLVHSHQGQLRAVKSPKGFTVITPDAIRGLMKIKAAINPEGVAYLSSLVHSHQGQLRAVKSPKGFTVLTRDVITGLMKVKAATNPEGVECHWRNEKPERPHLS